MSDERAIYLSGPISLRGRLSLEEVERNRQRFRERRAALEAQGYEVLDPTTIAGEPGWIWQDWMRAALTMMLRAWAVEMLPGWEHSPGARLERRLALDLGIAVLPGGAPSAALSSDPCRDPHVR